MGNYAEIAKTMTDAELQENLNRTRLMLRTYVLLASGAIGSGKNSNGFDATRSKLSKRYNAYQAEFDIRKI